MPLPSYEYTPYFSVAYPYLLLFSRTSQYLDVVHEKLVLFEILSKLLSTDASSSLIDVTVMFLIPLYLFFLAVSSAVVA